MSSLKQRVQAIQQQLALSTADTIARFQEVKASMNESFTKLETALADQGEQNKKALEELFDLVVEQDQQTQQKLADHESRLKRLEGAA